MMADSCREAERYINYQATFTSIHERSMAAAQHEFSVVESLASSALKVRNVPPKVVGV